MSEEPAALSRAASLKQHAEYLGAPLRDFSLVLNDAEAMELLEWYAKDTLYGTHPVFLRDLELARATQDPWAMLGNFTLLGFAFARRESLH